jgi:hypothetical protein
LQHLALDDERFWFQAVVAGDQAVIDQVMNAPEDSWMIGPDVTVEQVFDLYREHMDQSNAIIDATPLDAKPAWWPDFFPTFRLNNLREVILHVLTETAVHAGHLDATRELIDGRTWLVLSRAASGPRSWGQHFGRTVMIWLYRAGRPLYRNCRCPRALDQADEGAGSIVGSLDFAG